MMESGNKTTRRKLGGIVGEGRKMEFQRTLSHSQGKLGSSRRLLGVSYFSLESLLLLVCLTASLLILPLILPPLPPPPFMLLLLPICILALLMFLAFMPSNVRDLTYTYAAHCASVKNRVGRFWEIQIWSRPVVLGVWVGVRPMMIGFMAIGLNSSNGPYN